MNTNPNQKKIAVLGSGPAGYAAAIRAAQLGAEVTLIENKAQGGVCMNTGCIPTKALLETAHAAQTITNAKEFGITAHMDGNNFAAAINRKNRIVKNLGTGLDQLISGKGITVLKGEGMVAADGTLIVQSGSGERLQIPYEKLILSTGATTVIPEILGIELEGVVTSAEALDLQELPDSIAIIGAGVIGLEFANIFASLGVKVTILEQDDSFLSAVDAEIAAELLRQLKRQGISIRLRSYITGLKKNEDGLLVNYQIGEKRISLVCDIALAATGRKPNLNSIQALPLQIKNGAVLVNDRMETSIKGIYAAGDITGGELLAHLAFREGKVAAENAMGFETKVNYDILPSCIYTIPEVASIGMTEKVAKEAGINIKIGRFELRHNGRALTLGQRTGFVKIIADEKNRIIGGHILGTNASELITEISLAIALKATAEDLVSVIHPHPTLAEAIWEACGEIIGQPLHK